MTGAAELRGPVHAAVARGAAELEERVRRRRADEGLELRVRAPRVERVELRLLDALELGDALLGLLALLGDDLEGVELLLQVGRHAGRLLLRLEAGAVDGAVAGHAAVDARDVHVVHVHEEVGQHDLVDLERRGDEVEHREVEDERGALHLHRLELLVQQVDLRQQIFFLRFGVRDLFQPRVEARLGGVALAGHVLQVQLQVADVLLLAVVLGLLRGGVGAVLHDRGLGVVALRVEVGLGEAVVLVGLVVLPFPRVDVLLGQDELGAVPGQVDLVRAHLRVEVGELLLVRLRLGRLQLRLDPLALHAQELELEPLPAADVVVADHQHGHAQQHDARPEEDPVQAPHRVVVRNGLLRLHGLAGSG